MVGLLKILIWVPQDRNRMGHYQSFTSFEARSDFSGYSLVCPCSDYTINQLGQTTLQ